MALLSPGAFLSMEGKKEFIAIIPKHSNMIFYTALQVN